MQCIAPDLEDTQGLFLILIDNNRELFHILFNLRPKLT